MTYRPTPKPPSGAALAVALVIIAAQAEQDRTPCPECNDSYWVPAPEPGCRVPCMNSHHGKPIA